MRNKKHSLKSVICLLLVSILICSAIFCVAAAETDVAVTGAKGTVYYQNTTNWSKVYCYMWNGSGGTKNAEWPGVEMTLDKDNVYKYTTSTDYQNVIFNNGSGGNGNQTADLTFPGDGQIYNGSSWSVYPDHVPAETTDDPTTPPTPTNPPTPGTVKYVYCKNSAGWSSVNCYMWNSESDKNTSWPGASMQNIGDNIWQYEVTGTWGKVIFNNGSTQTGDLTFPGDGYMYDNSTGQWEIYDNSPLKVSDFGANLTSPQYKGTDITLTTTAKSDSAVSYKFSVKNPSGATTVLADFSAKNTAEWTPTAAGTYTLVFDYKDNSGNENQRTLEYKINDDAGVEEPIIKGVSPKPGQVKTGTQQTITVNASGGNTGTNLLFYKYKITDPSGNTVNVPYYSKTKTVSFTPTDAGVYTVTVYVQGSDNQTEERTYTYTSTSSDIPPVTESTPPSDEYMKGDADGDGQVSVMDSTEIQRHCAKVLVITGQCFTNADIEGDGVLTVMDATAIQRYIAKLGW